MKTKILPLLIALIVIVVSIPVSANTEITVYIDNEKINFDVPPMLVNGRTMAPMRFIFEKLGAEVEWNGETNTASAYKDGKYISIAIGSPYMDTFFKAVKLDVPAMIVDGRTLVPLRAVSEAFKCDVIWDDKNNTVNIYSENYIDYTKAKDTQTTISVSTADELINAIGSNKRIVLTSNYYNLSDVKTSNNEFVEKQRGWNEAFYDGFIIKNVVNMTIEGNAEIVINDIMADVLKFRKCGKITLSGLTIGHTTGNETYQCEGAVTRFDTCDNITINNCSLYGCGAFGVYADNVKNLKVNDTKIYDCTYTGIWLTGNSDASVINTEFFDSTHASGFIRIDNSKIDLINCNVHDIYCNGFGMFIDTFDFSGEPSVINVENCKFTDNVFDAITNLETINLKFTDCIFQNNSGNMQHSSVLYDNCQVLDATDTVE